MDSPKVLALCKRRGIVYPAFEIYGGAGGFYDYGPLGTRIKENVLAVWRRLYILGEGFVEIDGPTITPEDVLKASGHVEEFSDFLSICEKCSAPFRVDHLLGEYHENPDVLSKDELMALINDNDVKCERCGSPLSEPQPFNLMFNTHLGNDVGKVAYLRPETAQGIFVNFNQIYRFFREKLPFGAIQIGRGYRNEISPRQGMIRLREFNMAEAEIFFDPNDKSWSNFQKMAGESVVLITKDGEHLEKSIGQCVKDGVIGSQALAYFVGLTKRFLVEIGIDSKRLRFRQHLEQEQAHYSSECWDAEVETSFGWIEVVGIADRGCYDLSRHNEFSDANMSAFNRFDEPREMDVTEVRPDMSKLGKMFRSDAKKIADALMEMLDDADGDVEIVIDGKVFTVPADAYTVIKEKRMVSGERFVPHVIEPSYGVDRTIYCMLEHCYKENEVKGSGDEDAEPGVVGQFDFKSAVAPFKVGVFPLMAKDGLDEMAKDIDDKLRAEGIQTYYDAGGSIGKRYARMDEIGTPFCVTVDYDSKDDRDVTIRCRRTTNQKRVSMDELAWTLKVHLAENKCF
jgi:glycyl-tRNA synthetase